MRILIWEVKSKYLVKVKMKYEIVVPYATETTTQIYKYYWWSE